jgi:hypothetical protein
MNMKKIQWTTPEGEWRTGTLWSPGPTETSVWVIPDERREGEAHAVQVGKDGCQNRNHVEHSQQAYQERVRTALANRAVVPGIRIRTRWGIEEVPQHLAPRGGQTQGSLGWHVLDLCQSEETS